MGGVGRQAEDNDAILFCETNGFRLKMGAVTIQKQEKRAASNGMGKEMLS